MGTPYDFCLLLLLLLVTNNQKPLENALNFHFGTFNSEDVVLITHPHSTLTPFFINILRYPSCADKTKNR